jgi:hypothetical protein
LKRLLIAMPLALFLAKTGQAQSVRGRLVEAETDQPIPAAQITLVTGTGTAAAVAFTDAEGRFLLRVAKPGAFMMHSRRLGYRPRADAVNLADGELVIEVRLAPIPLTLDPVVVEAEVNARYLDLMGFYERQRSDFGQFLTRDDIEARRAVRVTDVLGAVPGVRLVPDSRSVGARVRVQFRGALTQKGSLCEPRVFVDGLIAVKGDSRPSSAVFAENPNDLSAEDPRAPDPAVDDVVDPRDIEAVEVYRSGVEVPAQFGGMGPYTRCGAIVIWTRRGQ